MSTELKLIFPSCFNKLSEEFTQKLEKSSPDPEEFPAILRATSKSERAEYLPDLAAVELARFKLMSSQVTLTGTVTSIQVNPNLELVQVKWHPLLEIIAGANLKPETSNQFLLIWSHPNSGEIKHAVATSGDLLALKIITEGLDPLDVAASHNQPVGVVDKALERAVTQGILLAPKSKLQRQQSGFSIAAGTPETFLQAEAFTLQWHITHSCDLNCRHCYDRSLLSAVGLEQGLKILDQMRDFCLRHYVYGQVSFSGGNPFLHPHFFELYRAAGERNLSPAILGNPVSEDQLDALLKIEKPVFYQVSLEGLQAHNDYIRGKGNFKSVFNFLDLLKNKQIYSMVMLTLTQDNMDQVLPLAELLRDRVDLFTYNRLSMVGEGANLESPRVADYHTFVRDYLKACRKNPIMAMKDNLINIECENQAQSLFGGCTGFGCGAAFNFVSLLPNGQIDACRKFPSPIGDINHQSLEEIYYSKQAKAYRKGSVACNSCHLRPVCGGCLAVSYGCGLDPLNERDPGCFIEKLEQT
ncbi:MAG: thio(seleno)oxazole modification radical SAM maturase SbtM [Desulfuromusa sp.]|nr:thio(seleno)oxazole modification radical SAM maturase SbtM [Desulfuromusa sp.]